MICECGEYSADTVATPVGHLCPGCLARYEQEVAEDAQAVHN